MAVLPVSSIGFDKKISTLNFGKRVDDADIERIDQPRAKTNKPNLAKVPVVVLLASTPTLLNSAIPEQFSETDQENDKIENVKFDYELDKAEKLEKTYVIAPAQQPKPPYLDWPGITPVVKCAPAKVNGKPYHMIWTAISYDHNELRSVYFADDRYSKKTDPLKRFLPPVLKKLTLHDCPDGQFCTAYLQEDRITNSPNGDIWHRYLYDVRLDDETAQDLIYLIENRHKSGKRVLGSNIEFNVVNTKNYLPSKDFIL